jgi:hypothetical protein
MKKILIANVNATATTYVGQAGQVVVDTNTFKLRVQDGVTPGGRDVALTTSQVSAGAIGVIGLSSSGTFLSATGTVITVATQSLTTSQVSAGAISVVGITSTGTLLSATGTAITVSTTAQDSLTPASSTLAPSVNAVNAALTSKADAISPLDLTISDFTSLNLTISTSTYANRLIRINVSSNVTLTIPADSVSGLSGSDQLLVLQMGSGTVTFIGSGASVAAASGYTLSTTGSGSQVSIIRTATNTFVSTQPASASSQNQIAGGASTAWAIIPMIGATSLSTLGITSLTASGTATSPPTGTTPYREYSRLRYTASTGTNTAAGYGPSISGSIPLVFGTKQYHHANVIGGVADSIGTGTKLFIGFGSNTLASVSTGNFSDNFLNWRLGIGHDSGDTTNMSLISAGDTGAATKTTLGASFPIPTVAESNIYRFDIKYYPASDIGGRRIEWKAEDLIVGSVATGVVTTNLPATGTISAFGPVARRIGLATTSSVIIDVGTSFAGPFVEWTL